VRGNVGGKKGSTRKPPEREAVRTTIVGARPPGSGKSPSKIPRGIEVLVKKASVDAKFRELLMQKRAEASREIGLKLEPAEQAILNGVPAGQLEAIIARTKVSRKSRAVFLGKAAAVMLAALGTATVATGCGVKGIRPEEEELSRSKVESPATEKATPDVEV